MEEREQHKKQKKGNMQEGRRQSARQSRPPQTPSKIILGKRKATAAAKSYHQTIRLVAI